jgi:hypothetical protein
MPWSLKKSIPNSAVLRIPFVSTTYTESVQMRIQAYVAVVLFRGYKSLVGDVPLQNTPHFQQT